jgi:diketogulonate reductase-like aldo/keto reductase
MPTISRQLPTRTPARLIAGGQPSTNPKRHLGIGLIPHSPLHAGLLTGAWQAADRGPVSAEQQDRVTAHRDRLQAYEQLCQDIGAPPADVALAWVLRNPVVSATIMGAMTIRELRANLGAPGGPPDRRRPAAARPGEAPKAYAW